jgi:predicted DNA-binding protein with PD1-like motif
VWREKALEGRVGRICFYRLLEGEDLLVGMQERIARSGMNAGFFMAIGALRNAVLGLYHTGKYKQIEADGPLEIAACMGNVALNEASEIVVHAHVVVSNKKGEALGGHLMRGCIVDPTAELIVLEALDIKLVRAYDEKTKLNLLKLM